jgi:hypothetical protein
MPFSRHFKFFYALSSSLIDSNVSLRLKQQKDAKLGTFPDSQHFRGRRACWSSGMGLRKVISKSITHTNLHKSNNKLVSA